MNALHLSESFQTFILSSDNRIAKAIKRFVLFPFGARYMTEERYSIMAGLYRKMFTTNEINYLTFRTDGTISYLPAGKEHVVTDSGEWSRKGRQTGKPGKVIRKLFTPLAQRLFKDHDFESFANQYKAYYSEDLKFELRDNEDIPFVYRMDSGPFTSCMQGEDEDYFDIYKYCEDVKILTLTSPDDTLMARALVWTADAKYFKGDDLVEEKVTFLDRVYCSDVFMQEMFFEYSKDKKWWRKRYQTSSDKRSFVTSDGMLISAEMTVLTDTDHDHYPYMDTMYFGDDGSLSNRYGHYEYDSTDGERSNDPRFEEDDHDGETYDDINDEYISDEYASYIDMGEKAGLMTHCDNVVHINGYTYWDEDRNIQRLADGDYVLNEDAYFCEHDQDYYEADDVIWSDQDECWYHEKYVVESEQGWILHSDAVEVDGLTYHKDEAPEPEEDEEETEEYDVAA
jgi:hypothetical protein